MMFQSLVKGLAAVGLLTAPALARVASEPPSTAGLEARVWGMVDTPGSLGTARYDKKLEISGDHFKAGNIALFIKGSKIPENKGAITQLAYLMDQRTSVWRPSKGATGPSRASGHLEAGLENFQYPKAIEKMYILCTEPASWANVAGLFDSAKLATGYEADIVQMEDAMTVSSTGGQLTLGSLATLQDSEQIRSVAGRYKVLTIDEVREKGNGK